jgi:hypothetical protein
MREEVVLLRMLQGLEVKQATAETVLAAFNRLTPHKYTLSTVRINLDEEEMRRERDAKKRGRTSSESNT